MIVNYIITMAIWIYQITLLKLPNSLPGIPISTFETGLNNFINFVSVPLYIINKFFPWTELINCILAIIALETLFFSIRATVFAWNMVRGSGAKV